jgi:hypothetical protein
MNTSMLKKVPVYAVAALMLAAVVHAQSGQMKSGQSCSMMGEMKMDGPVTASGKACQMKCDMMPMGKSQGMKAHSMMGKDGKAMDMGKMPMNKPMKMSGTMSCMGQTYHCNMMVTPKAK